MKLSKILMSLIPILGLVCGCNLWQEEKQLPAPDCRKIEQQANVNTLSGKDPAAAWRTLDLKKYPDANTILLDELESVRYNCDGTYTRQDESWTLIVTENGRKQSRNISLHFNEFYQQIPDLLCEIVKPDGRVIKPVLQKNIITESSQMQSNIYDPSNKVLNVGIPDLEIGDIIHISYTMQQIRPRMRDVWCDMTILQSLEPVLHYVYEVSAPEKCPLTRIAVKDEVKGTLKRSEFRQDGRIIYRFEAENVPQLIPEPDMPAHYLHCMRVLCSTAPDWETISRWYYNLCEPHLQAVSPELTAYAGKLTQGKNAREAVRKLFDFVSKEIRYTGVTNENTAPGYEPHDVKDTFAQKHGVCRDKAALLTAMLRAVGFDAFMVLFMAGDPKDQEVPNYYFNHAITGVKMPDGELILMDSTDENTSDLLPAYAMDKSFLCATAQGDVLRRTPVVSPQKNMLMIRSQGVMNKDYQLHLKSELIFNGINDNIYRGAFARWTPEYRRQFVASMLKKVLPGSELVHLKITPENVRDLSVPLTMTIECKVDDYADIKWGAGCLRMPFLSNGFGALNFMLDDRMLKNRRYPMMLFSTAGVDEQCSLTLPDGLEMVALPEFKNINTGLLRLTNSVHSRNKLLSGKRMITLEGVKIDPEAYADFRKAVLDCVASDNNRIIVRRNLADKVNFAAAAVLNDSRITVKIESPDSWVVDCQQEIKVLNYSGVKDYSELTIPFIPGISEGKFIAGSVTDPTGKSVDVKLQTVLVMDDDAAAAAPRYPVGKKMVVPLPGVKPGSVIKYHWQLRYCGLPGGDFITSLWKKIPVLNSRLEFVYPERLAKKIMLTLPEAGFRVEKNSRNGINTVVVFSSSIPERPDEPGTPPAEFFAPTAGISLFNAAEYCELVRKTVRQAAADAPAARALAQRITAHIPDLPGKIRAIRDYVARNIRPAGPELDTLGVKYITAADVTLRENYGNSADRAVLLYAMLQAIGVEKVNLLLVADLPDLPEIRSQFIRLPHNCFEQVLLVVKSGEQELFLNDTDEYAPLEYSSNAFRLALDTFSGELITVCTAPEFSSAVRQEWVVKMLPGGSAEFTRISSFYGGEFAGQKRYFANITPEKERQFWEQQFSGVLAGAEMLDKSRDFKLYPGQITMRFTVADFWKKSGDYISFTLPDGGIASLVRTAGKRSLPYWFFPGSKREVNFTVELPDSWQFCELDGGNYSFILPGNPGGIKQTAAFTRGLLEVKFCSDLENAVYIPVQAYGVLEELQKKLANPANRTFLFKSTGK